MARKCGTTRRTYRAAASAPALHAQRDADRPRDGHQQEVANAQSMLTQAQDLAHRQLCSPRIAPHRLTTRQVSGRRDQRPQVQRDARRLQHAALVLGPPSLSQIPSTSSLKSRPSGKGLDAGFRDRRELERCRGPAWNDRQGRLRPSGARTAPCQRHSQRLGEGAHPVHTPAGSDGAADPVLIVDSIDATRSSGHQLLLPLCRLPSRTTASGTACLRQLIFIMPLDSHDLTQTLSAGGAALLVCGWP